MISLSDLRSNPALLKLDLYCKGVRLDDSCLVEEDGGRKILRTRAGLGNVHVSLVMLPEECRTLSPHRYPLQTLKLRAMAKVFGRRFGKRLERMSAAPAAPGPAATSAGALM